MSVKSRFPFKKQKMIPTSWGFSRGSLSKSKISQFDETKIDLDSVPRALTQFAATFQVLIHIFFVCPCSVQRSQAPQSSSKGVRLTSNRGKRQTFLIRLATKLASSAIAPLLLVTTALLC